MKKFLIVFATLMFFCVNNVLANEEYVTKNLEEALTEEGIEHDLKNYEETSDQVTIYLFRGNGCSHCRDFLTFLNSIVDEYGSYFKLVSYETWYDQANNKLMSRVSKFLDGKKAEGVPYIIIGNKSFGGYGSSSDEEIISTIMSEYSKETRYDVIKDYEENGSSGDGLVVGIIFGVLIIGFTGLVIYSRKTNTKID